MVKHKVISGNNTPFTFPVELIGYFKQNSLRVDIEGFEAVLDTFFECEISNVSFGEAEEQAVFCEDLIKHYYNNQHERDGNFFRKLSREFFGGSLKPSAMFCEGVPELMGNIFAMYQLSYAHYILGKNRKMEGRFPRHCCGTSSRNLLAALWEARIVSAVVVCNDSYDHTYVIVPFVVREPNINGVILVDPTSDQLMYNKSERVRNNILIMTERKWTYKTDWANGESLYPESVEVTACYGSKHKNYDKYIERALKNPVVVV